MEIGVCKWSRSKKVNLFCCIGSDYDFYFHDFIEVPKSQMERDLTYEPFKVEGGGNNE